VGIGGRQWGLIGYDGTPVSAQDICLSGMPASCTLLLMKPEPYGAWQIYPPERFDFIQYGNRYASSSLLERMEAATSVLSAGERALLVRRSVNDESGNWSGEFWPLSLAEASLLCPELRRYAATRYDYSWWLRSPGERDGEAAAFDWEGKYRSLSVGDAATDMRPAFEFATDKVLFATLAVGGKRAAPGSALAAFSAPEGAIKLTLQNGFAPNFAVAQSQISAFASSEVSIDYQGAYVGDNSFISAMVTPTLDTKRILFYGRLQSVSSAAGSARLVLPPELTDNSYQIRVFNEQINGDNYCDFASVSEDLPVNILLPTPPATLTRYAGVDRHDTAARASAAVFSAGGQGFPRPAHTAIVTCSHTYPDALAASALAGVCDAPLLLTQKDSLSSYTADELNRLAPTTVLVVGREPSVSASVFAQIAALPFAHDTVRIGGEDRYATASLLAQQAVDKGARAHTAFLAKGSDYPDALAASPFATAQKMPLLLTGETALAAQVEQFFIRNRTGKVYVLGSELSISEAVCERLRQLGIATERLGGADRYETASIVVRALTDAQHFDFTPALVGVATGERHPDALCGGVAVGLRGGVVVLTPAAELHPATESLLQMLATAHPDAEIFGDENSVGAHVEASLRRIFNLRDDL
jgi:putative cell wall-binding protein